MTRLQELIERAVGTTGPIAGALSASEWHELQGELVLWTRGHITIDYYEGSNLLWLLNVASRIHLDTGDWCGQIRHKLEDRPDVKSAPPNSDESDTNMRLRMAALEVLGLTHEDVKSLHNLRMETWLDEVPKVSEEDMVRAFEAIDKISGRKIFAPSTGTED